MKEQCSLSEITKLVTSAARTLVRNSSPGPGPGPEGSQSCMLYLFSCSDTPDSVVLEQKNTVLYKVPRSNT